MSTGTGSKAQRVKSGYLFQSKKREEAARRSKTWSFMKRNDGQEIFFLPSGIFMSNPSISLDYIKGLRKLLHILKEEFGIEQNFVRQSEVGISGLGTELLVALAKELGATEVILPDFSDKAVECGRFSREQINVKFLRYDPLPYPQFWGKFIPKLSALDLLFCMGKEGKHLLEKGSFISARGE
jgi:hypothetical protein